MSVAPQQADLPAKPNARDRILHRLLIVLTGAFAAITMVLLPANNTFVATIEAAFLASMAVAFVDWAVFQHSRLFPPRLIVACLLGGGIGYYFQLTPSVAFQRAFGCAPPDNAKNVRICGHYVGTFGDLFILIQFTASEADLADVLSHHPFVRDDEMEARWRNQAERPAVWRQLFDGWAQFGGKPWRKVDLPDHVRVFQWRADPVTATKVLWNVDTGRTYVLYIFG